MVTKRRSLIATCPDCGKVFEAKSKERPKGLAGEILTFLESNDRAVSMKEIREKFSKKSSQLIRNAMLSLHNNDFIISITRGYWTYRTEGKDKD